MEWSVEDDRVDVEVGQVGDQFARGDDRAVGQLTEPFERLVTDRDGDQRPWPAATVSVGSRSDGQFDEGVEASLGAAARQLAVFGEMSFVGEAELVVDAVPRFGEGCAADAVEDRLDVELAVDAVERRGLPVGPCRLRPVVVSGEGIDSLPPILDRFVGLPVRQFPAEGDQLGLVVDEMVTPRPRVGGGQQVDVVDGDRPVLQRRQRRRHRRQRLAPADHLVGRATPQTCLTGEAGTSGTGTILGPHATAPPLLGEFELHRLQPRQRGGHLDEVAVHFAVGEGRNVGDDEIGQRLLEGADRLIHNGIISNKRSISKLYSGICLSGLVARKPAMAPNDVNRMPG